MGTLEKLELMKKNAYNQIGIVFNSNGEVLTKSQLKGHINSIILGKLNFAISFCIENNISHLDLQKIKDLL